MTDPRGGYFLALLATTAFGSADFLGGFSTRRVGLVLTALATQLAGCVALAAGVLVDPGHPAVPDLLWGAVAGVADCAGLLLLFRALAVGQMAAVAPTAGVMSSALPVVAGFFFGERPAPVQWAGIGLGLAAIVAISWEQPKQRAPGRQQIVPLAMAAAAGAGFAVYYILFSHYVSSASGISPVLSARISSTLVIVAWTAWAAKQHGGFPRCRPAQLSLAVLTGVLASAGNLLFVLAVRHGQLALIAVLASLYPAVTAILAIAFLSERPRVWQLAGIGGAVTAVGLIAAR